VTSKRGPDFIVVGAQKAGTTWLHRQLMDHPRISLPVIKEIHYFDTVHLPAYRLWTENRRLAEANVALAACDHPTPAMASLLQREIGDDWYLDLFNDCPADSLTGEFTPDYCLLPLEGLRHIKSLFPAVKIMFLMRDPIGRCASHLGMKWGDRSYDSEVAAYWIREDVDRVVSRSRYERILPRLTELFADNFLALAYEEIGSSPLALLDRVCQFLGIGRFDRLSPAMRRTVNEGATPVSSRDIAPLLAPALQASYDFSLAQYPEIASLWPDWPEATGERLDAGQSAAERRQARDAPASAKDAALRHVADWAIRSLRSAAEHHADRVYPLLRLGYRALPMPTRYKERLAERLFHAVPALSPLPAEAAQSDANEDNGHAMPIGCSPGAQRRRVLIAERRIPTPDINASSLRLMSLLRLIADEGWEITFLSADSRDRYGFVLSNVDGQLPSYERDLSTLGVRVLYGRDEAVAHLAEEGGSYRAAILSTPDVMYAFAPIVRAYMPVAFLIYDIDDLQWLRLARQAAVEQDEAVNLRATRAWQMDVVNLAAADRVTVVTDAEGKRILDRSPNLKITVLPTVHAPSAASAGPKNRKGLLFIGHYNHAPNRDAVRHFVHDIMPLLRAKLGGVEFTMLGSAMSEEQVALGSSDVRAVGYVADPTAYFDVARVFVAPLRFGAGMKGKIGQSLGLGLPVVTTKIGAEGMGLEAGKHVLIADGAESFADAVLRLCIDDHLWLSLSRAGREHVRRHFSPAAIAPRVRELLALAEEQAMLTP